MPTAHSDDHYGLSKSSNPPSSNPSPTETELLIKLDAEPSMTTDSVVTGDQSSATTALSAMEKADMEPWR